MTAQETSERGLLAIEAMLKARAFCFVRPNGDHEGHFGFTEAEVAIIQSALAATRAAGDAPVAWRWRPYGAVLWIYNPSEEWLDQHRHEVEVQPLYAAPIPRPQRGAESNALDLEGR